MGPKHEESLVGKTFEKCRIIAKLGTGGMGSVWLAEHFGLGRKVAVKILPPEMGRDPEYVARFMREATTAGRMEHPNIVQIHDVGYAEGRHFIVMQYVDGESLATVVENLGAMDPRDAAKIAAGMLRGLQHAHDEGVVHRDVKPDNVLIARGDEPKLLDFGLAIETETALQITKDGMVVGTPYYLAPEQARGQKATPLCDIYAAGVTLYYLLTGKRPFVGATALAVLNKHIHEPPVPPQKHRPAIPKALNDIVLKMMAKRPADRYQSAGAAADDLEAFLKGKQIQVKVPVQIRLPFGLATPPALAALSKNQLIALAASTGGLFLLLLVLLVAAFAGGKPAPPPPRENPGNVQTKPPGPPPRDEAALFAAVYQFEQQNRDAIAAYPAIVNKWDVYIASTTSADYRDRAVKQRKSFLDHAEMRADQELDQRLREPDPHRRHKSLQEFPQILLDLTPIDKRLREELLLTHGKAETRFLEDWRKLDGALDANRFREAEDMVDALLPFAEGPRKEQLERLKKDLPRRRQEFDDEIFRRLSTTYDKVHEDFQNALKKRETGTAFALVTKFLRDQGGEAERQRTRVTGINYELMVRPYGEKKLDDEHFAFRETVSGAFGRAQNSLPYRILSDLLDALDVEFIVREATRGLRAAWLDKTEVRLATMNGATGLVMFEGAGFQFVAKGSPAKPFDYRTLQAPDLLPLAAVAAGGQNPEDLLATSGSLARAMGAAWLSSGLAERWAEAVRCFTLAAQNGVPGLQFRIESVRDQGKKDVYDRILASKKELENKKFDAAKQLLVAVEAAWSQDPVLSEEIGRAMATILVAEVLHHERNRDYARLKQAARLLRAKYPKLYPEEMIIPPYAHALRQTGQWNTTGNLLNDDWTWEGKAQNAECPAVDDTRNGRGLKLKPEKAIRVAPTLSRGAYGAVVALALSKPSDSYSVGFRFDVSDSDGTYQKLVIRDTGEVALYAFDGREEKRVDRGPLGRKLAPMQWTELRFVAEGGDLVAFVDDRPVLLTRAEMAPDRAVELWSSVEANFRGLYIHR